MNPPSVNWQTIRRNLKVGSKTPRIFLLAVMATRGHPVRSPFTYLMVRPTSAPIRHQKWRFGCIERFCVFCKINNLHTINVRSGFDSLSSTITSVSSRLGLANLRRFSQARVEGAAED